MARKRSKRPVTVDNVNTYDALQQRAENTVPHKTLTVEQIQDLQSDGKMSDSKSGPVTVPATRSRVWVRDPAIGASLMQNIYQEVSQRASKDLVRPCLRIVCRCLTLKAVGREPE
jgi:hypothetical protein